MLLSCSEMEFTLDRTLEILSSTPSVFRQLLGGLSNEWTASASRENWGPYDIVGHLIYCETDDWMPRARMILDHGTARTFDPFDRFAQFELSKGRSLAELLDQFASLRHENIDTLRSWDLSDDQLDRLGSHPEFGPVSLRQLLSTWTVHDLTHIRQTVTVMAKKYDEAVGPWSEYLSILK